MTMADNLLEKHSLTRDTARKFVDAIVRLNQSRAAEEIGVNRKTVQEYRQRFAEMCEEERVFLIGGLFLERNQELRREERD